jgi:hypothetical protein
MSFFDRKAAELAAKKKAVAPPLEQINEQSSEALADLARVAELSRQQEPPAVEEPSTPAGQPMREDFKHPASSSPRKITAYHEDAPPITSLPHRHGVDMRAVIISIIGSTIICMTITAFILFYAIRPA